MNRLRLVDDLWLARHLGKPAFHLVGDIRSGGLEQVAEQLRAKSAFADAKVPVDDVTSIAALERLGYSLIDTNIQFGRPRSGMLTSAIADIGFARAEMADAVGEIAERSFVHDRFHRDPEIPNAIACALKGDWARNYFNGLRGDWMVVANHGGVTAGFLQLLRSQSNDLVIDLIAVDQPHQGLGLAKAMIAFAAKYCDIAGSLVVGTQVANVPSVRLYESLGFQMTAAQYVFHYHGRT